jgi:hypothetical protein
MNDRTKLGLRILMVSGVMGLLGDALLRETPWGINVVVWAAALVAAVTVLHFKGMELASGGLWLGLATIGFAGMIAWRDSTTLKVLDGLGLAGALSLAAFRSRSGRVLMAGITDYVRGFFVVGYNAAFGTPLLMFDDIRWSEISARNRLLHFAAAGRGFDAAYATSLSADAVPALVAALPSLNHQERLIVASHLVVTVTALERADWRAGSWSRREAWHAITRNSPVLWSAAQEAEESGTRPSPSRQVHRDE